MTPVAVTPVADLPARVGTAAAMPHAIARDSLVVPSPAAVLAAFDTMAARDLWPGFTPRTTPLALFDGTRTFLVRHPSPPGGPWAPAGIPGVVVREGRLPQVTANSSDTIGGVMSGTVMPAPPGRSARLHAAIAMHELFHVYQRVHHPRWSANEADAFTYPATDVSLLAARRREYALLRKALATRDRGDAACHAAVALSFRFQRFARMASEHVAYERLEELNEGLAQYVQWRAFGAPDARAVPDSMPQPDAVRAHAYNAGPAWGRLLDRFVPAWRARLERTDTLSLDALLRGAIGATETERPGCGLSNAAYARIDADAARDVAALASRIVRQREGFERAAGGRLEVVAGATPIFPMGFDPLNVVRVAPRDVIHQRYVKVGNKAGSIEVLDRASLTEGAGAHPLFNGVRRFVVTGLEPDFGVRSVGDTLVLTGRGVSGRFTGARLERAGDTTRVVLAP
ncbi:MAG: hypothetical protein HY275_19215 [Gemmatimonadetes bacterium]|nr:hypothetical protein [Gemmatimonadota bacterium]